MSLINIPSKEDTEYEDCSMIHLLDENYCIKQSLDLISHNIASLSTRSIEINEFAANWNDTYTLFSQNSAAWSQAAKDVINYNTDWSKAYSTVHSLSSMWNFQEFTVYFDRVIRMEYWFSTNVDSTLDSVSAIYVQKFIPNWLKKNFDPTNYISGQPVNVYLYLSYDNSWQHGFKRTYLENCIPAGSVTYRTYRYSVNEKGVFGPEKGDDPCFTDYSNPKAKPAQVHLWDEFETGSLDFDCELCNQPYYQGCNHHGGRAGYGPCTNAYDGCTRNAQQEKINYTCPNCASPDASGGCSGKEVNSGPKSLTIDSTWAGVDTQTARIIGFQYVNTGSLWTFRKDLT